MLRWSRDKDRDKTDRGAGGETGDAGLFRTHARPVRPLEEPRAVRAAAAPGDAPVTLEGILVSEGTVTPQELKAAQEVQAKQGGFLGQILIDLGYIDANSLTSFLAKHCKIPHLSLLDYLIDDAQVNLVPREICLKYRLLPIDRLGKNLTVAMVNPLDTQALEEVRRVCPELRVKPILCEYSHFLAVAKRVFKIEEAAREVSMDTLGLGRGPSQGAKGAAPPQQPKTAPSASDLEPLGQPHPRPTEAPTEALKPAKMESAPPPPPRAAEHAPHAQGTPAAAPPAPKPQPTPPQQTVAVQEQPVEAPRESEGSSEQGFDDEAVLEAFFGMADEGDREGEDRSEQETRAGSSSVLQEMVAIMGDSMRDTYGMLARKLGLFNGLTSEQVAKIFAKGITREFDEGQVVFNEGEKGEDLYVILGGSVAISHNGSEVTRLIAGDAFGETALFTHEPRNATATAVETSSFLVLNEKAIRRILDKDTALQLLGNLVISLSRRLRQKSESS